MKELLSAGRNLHHLIIILCFAIISFTLQPDELGRMRRAAAELDVIRQLPRPQFGELVKAERHKVIVGIWKRVAWSLPEPRRGLSAAFWSGKIPVILPLPGQSDSIEKWETSLQSDVDPLGDQVGREKDHLRFLVPDKGWDLSLQPVIQALAKMPQDEIKSLNYVGIEVAAVEVPDKIVAKEIGQDQGVVLRDLPQPPVGTATLHVVIKDPMEFDIDFSGSPKPNAPRTVDTAAWRGGLIEEKGALVKPDDFVTAGDQNILYGRSLGEKVPLPWCRYYWDDLRALSPQEGLHWLRAQIRAKEVELPIGNINVPMPVYSLAGSTALALLLIYLAVHVRQAFGIVSAQRHHGDELRDTAWAAMFNGVLAIPFVVGTLWLLPVWATYRVSIQRPLQPARSEIFLGVMEVAAVAVAGGWACVSVVRLKRARNPT